MVLKFGSCLFYSYSCNLNLIKKIPLESNNFKIIRVTCESVSTQCYMILYDDFMTYLRIRTGLWQKLMILEFLPPPPHQEKNYSNLSNPLPFIKSVYKWVICEFSRNGRVFWMIYVKISKGVLMEWKKCILLTHPDDNFFTKIIKVCA